MSTVGEIAAERTLRDAVPEFVRELRQHCPEQFIGPGGDDLVVLPKWFVDNLAAAVVEHRQPVTGSTGALDNEPGFGRECALVWLRMVNLHVVASTAFFNHLALEKPENLAQALSIAAIRFWRQETDQRFLGHGAKDLQELGYACQLMSEILTALPPEVFATAKTKATDKVMQRLQELAAARERRHPQEPAN